MAIKVSEKTVAQLRKGTMAGNLAKAKNASPEMKEALTRFYGAKRVKAAMGTPKAPTQAVKAMPMAAKKVPAQAKRAGVSEGSKAMKTTTRPSGTVAKATGAKATGAKGTGNTKRVNKPLFDITKIGGNSQAKLNTKAAATQALLEKTKKARMANASKNKK